MKRYRILFSLLALVVVLQACREETPDAPSVKVWYEPASPEIGETVTFFIQHDAELVSLYTGDTLHNFEKSLYKMVDYSQRNDKIFATPIPGYQEYWEEFRKLSAIPAMYEFSDAVDASMAKDPVTGNMAMKLSVDTANHEAQEEVSFSFEPNAIIRDKEGVTTYNETKNMEIRVRFDYDGENENTNKFVTELKGSLRVWFDGVEIVDYLGVLGDKSAVLGDTITIAPGQYYNSFVFGLEPFKNAWMKENGDVEPGLMTKVEFNLTGEFKRGVVDVDGVDVEKIKVDGLLGNMYVDRIRVSENQYYPFDTGFAVSTPYGQKISTFEYEYKEEGDFNVMVVGTNVGDKVHSVTDYNDVRNYSIEEYNYVRTFKSFNVSVMESVVAP